MDTKEATEFCELQGSYCPQRHMRANYYNIITLLQRGEKYEQMWNKFKKDSGHFLLGIVDNGKIGEGFTIKVLMNILEKGVNKSV